MSVQHREVRGEVQRGGAATGGGGGVHTVINTIEQNRTECMEAHFHQLKTKRSDQMLSFYFLIKANPMIDQNHAINSQNC